MKHFYITAAAICLATGAFAQNGQILNGGFENWTTVNLYDYPTSWGNSNVREYSGAPTVLKSTDAQLGTYSSEIQVVESGPHNDTLFGYVYQGTIGQTGPSGGISYTTPFDEVRVQYKCDMPVGDTMYLLVVRYTAGTMTEMILKPAAYGTHASWTQSTISLTNLPQDQLFIGFIMGNPFGGATPTPGSWARIDHVEMYHLGSSTLDIPDPSFESWTAQSTEIPDNWFTLNESLAGTNSENAIKTPDAHTGIYAVELTTNVDAITSDTVNSYLSAGPIDFYSMYPFLPVPYVAHPTTVSGAYKYSAANGDQGALQITFFQGGNPIGSFNQNFTQNVAYTTFSSPLTISGTPDSMALVVFSGANPGSVLKLDDLAFSGGNVGLDEFAAGTVSIYPNPASDIVMIKANGVYGYELVSVCGSVIQASSGLTGPVEVNVSGLTPGAYFVRLNSETATEVRQLVVE